MGVYEVKPEQLLNAESVHVEENTSETRITKATDSGTCDLEDKSLNSSMFRRKSQGSDSKSKGQRTKQTIASRQADSTQTAGNESKGLSSAPVTNTKKVSVKNVEVKIPSHETSQKPADKNDGGLSSATSPKSKIPVRSTSNAEVKSPVVPDKTVTDISGTLITLKSEKTPETPQKCKPVHVKNAEVPGENREGSPTITATKQIKEKSEVGSHPVSLVNGLENEGAEATVKPTHPPPKKDLDCSYASSTSNSRLPVSVQARKKNQDLTDAGRTDSSAVPDTETERSKTERGPSADRGDKSLGKTRTTDTSPTSPESTQKGKTST